MNVSNSTSSINAHQELLNSSAHNIANSITKGFERLDTEIVEASNNSVTTVTDKIESTNPYSNTDLAKEMTGQIISYQAVGANAVSIQTQDEVSGTLLDIKA